MSSAARPRCPTTPKALVSSPEDRFCRIFVLKQLLTSCFCSLVARLCSRGSLQLLLYQRRRLSLPTDRQEEAPQEEEHESERRRSRGTSRRYRKASTDVFANIIYTLTLLAVTVLSGHVIKYALYSLRILGFHFVVCFLQPNGKCGS